MAVVAVLAVAGDLGCTREHLLALLWPESDDARARHALRDALHDIRRALTPGSIRSVGSVLRLDASVIATDVLAFTQGVASGRLADAVRACGGPLLKGFHLDDAPEFEHWLSSERSRLERDCVEALEELAAAAEQTGAWAEAARWWGRALEHDPANSRYVLGQMRALSASGDRANAIQVGESHIRRLAAEFGLEPDRAVPGLIEAIRRGELSGSRETAAGEPTVAPTDRPPPAEKGPGTGDAPRPPGGDRTPARAIPVHARVPPARVWLVGVAAVVAVVVAIHAFRGPRHPEAGARAPLTAIAVLPFDNLTADTSKAWVAVGLHDELLARLSKVAALRVIGPASVSGYRRTSKSLAQIGEELAVGSIVHGSVQVLGNRARVIVELTDPGTSADLWAETYDRPLDDAFAVQTDIAERIVSAVGITLSRADSGSLTASPTASAEAYLLYLQGLDYARRPGDQRENLAIAQRLYEGALRLDSTFALAHAALAMVHQRVLFARYDASAARAALQLQEARAALRIAPELPEAHVAMALAYCCGRQSDRRMLQEYSAAARSAQNDASLWAAMSFVYARLGIWDSVDLAFEHARRLDPRNADLFRAEGNRLHCRRRYAEAIAMYRRALLLAPDYIQPHIALAWSYVLWKGELDTLRIALSGMPDVEPGGAAPRVGYEQALVLLWERRPDSLLALLRTLRGQVWTSGETFQPRSELAGWAHLLRGDAAAARAAFDSAALLLEAAARRHPDDPRVHQARGVILAVLGRRAEALREVRWLEQSEGYRNDHNCPMEPEARAIILTLMGETDSALAAVERLLSGVSRVTVHTLRLDPRWDRLRGDPRFQALLVKYAIPGS